jgi:hypothetical protein
MVADFRCRRLEGAGGGVLTLPATFRAKKISRAHRVAFRTSSPPSHGLGRNELWMMCQRWDDSARTRTHPKATEIDLDLLSFLFRIP